MKNNKKIDQIDCVKKLIAKDFSYYNAPGFYNNQISSSRFSVIVMYLDANCFL